MASCKKLLFVFAAVVCLIAPIGGDAPALGDSTSQEGCKNQWMFNGVWRVQVTDVQPYVSGGQQTGWQVTEVWRNGFNQEAAPSDSDYRRGGASPRRHSRLATAIRW